MASDQPCSWGWPWLWTSEWCFYWSKGPSASTLCVLGLKVWTTPSFCGAGDQIQNFYLVGKLHELKHVLGLPYLFSCPYLKNFHMGIQSSPNRRERSPHPPVPLGWNNHPETGLLESAEVRVKWWFPTPRLFSGTVPEPLRVQIHLASDQFRAPLCTTPKTWKSATWTYSSLNITAWLQACSPVSNNTNCIF